MASHLRATRQQFRLRPAEVSSQSRGGLYAVVSGPIRSSTAWLRSRATTKNWDSLPDYTSEIGGRFRKQNSTLPKVPIQKGPSAAEPHYIYYHIYAPDGILRCKITLNALVQAEGLPDPIGDLTGLFPSRDAQAVMDLNACVDILAVQLLSVASKDDMGNYLGSELTLLYYRLYNRGGEEKSARPFNPSEPGLRRVRQELISPPRNALYMKQHIGRVEGKPIYLFANLFTDLGADSSIPSAALVDNAADSSKEHPIVLVQPEHRTGLYNWPVQILALLPLLVPHSRTLG
ncbi:hypothetical protein B0H14DRAFT_2658957 [Mycena olivaceomarginata]|nr:hypothetical protein B0H14DRAFT_2658957 [Mycena olivaceomarginata]